MLTSTRRQASRGPTRSTVELPSLSSSYSTTAPVSTKSQYPQITQKQQLSFRGSNNCLPSVSPMPVLSYSAMNKTMDAMSYSPRLDSDAYTFQKKPLSSGKAHASSSSSVRGIRSKTGEVGLQNLGNSCFMNSSLQCLLHLEDFVNYFLEDRYMKDINKSSPCEGIVAESFAELIKVIHEAKKKSQPFVSPSDFLRSISKLVPHLMNYRQQDCQEFLRFLLDSLSEDLHRPKQGTSETHDSSSSSSSSSSRGENQMTETQSQKSRESKVHRLRNDTLQARESPDQASAPARPQMTSPAADYPVNPPCLSSNTGSSSPLSNRRVIETDLENLSTNKEPTSVSSSTVAVNLEAAEERGLKTESADSSSRNSSQLSVPESADKSWSLYLNMADSIISDMFSGQLQSTIECLTCRHKSNSFDPYLELCLPIPESSKFSRLDYGKERGNQTLKYTWPKMRSSAGTQSDKQYSLHECMKEFTQDEVLDGEEMYKCEYCKEKKKSVKKLYIYRLPQILVVQLKRFKAPMGLPMMMGGEKISTNINFPLRDLDLTPYLSPESVFRDKGAKYDLVGVSHHVGSLHGGHYVAQVNDGSGWIQCNDDRVDPVDEGRVGGPSAYVLFYKLQKGNH